MFILGGTILEISNHQYSPCHYLGANVEITGHVSMLHTVLPLVYLPIADDGAFQTKRLYPT